MVYLDLVELKIKDLIYNWCFGDRDECKINEELEKEFEEANKECPYRKECKWVTINVKNDKCTTCGKIYTYP